MATTSLLREDDLILLQYLFYLCASLPLAFPACATTWPMASTMDGFDPLAMPYMHSPMPFAAAGNVQNLDYMSVPSVMDLQDQYSNFDSEPYMRCDRSTFTLVLVLTLFQW